MRHFAFIVDGEVAETISLSFDASLPDSFVNKSEKLAAVFSSSPMIVEVDEPLENGIEWIGG